MERSRGERRPPNLFVAGVQKSGTTLLCRYLSEHDAVIHSSPKEPFDMVRPLSPDGFESYLKTKFPDESTVPGWRYKADGSTTLFQSRAAIRNIETYCGRDVRVIAVLRNPVRRAVSHYFHDVKRGRGPAPEGILKLYYVDKSTYSPHLKRWREWCDPGRFLVLR
jgi:hypothetical protein